ncbi:hypothetical protein EPAKOI_001072 [Cupriavidus sp. H18C2]
MHELPLNKVRWTDGREKGEGSGIIENLKTAT